MASTDYDYAATRNEILARAFRIIGVLALGESLSSDMYNQGVQAMQSMIKQWQTRHVFLWTVQQQSITLAASDRDYSVSNDPPPLWIERAYFVRNSEDEPIRVISYREYLAIEDKTEERSEVEYVAFQQGVTPTVWVWPTPNAVGTIKIDVVTALEDWDAAAGTEDFPVRWQDALTYGVASHLSHEYGLPLSERQLLKSEAEEKFFQAKANSADRSEISLIRSAF